MKKLPISSITVRDAHPDTPLTHVAPVYLSSTYIYESAEHASKVFEGKEEAFIYSRWSHPNAVLVEEKLAALEGYDLPKPAQALAFSSGMAAISALMQTLLQAGDTVLMQGNVYGTTVDYIRHTEQQLKLKVIFFDPADLEVTQRLLQQERPRLMYVESPANPTLSVYDLTALAKLAKRTGAVSVIDSTFASPLLQRPLKHGFDLVVHSSTKYLNGHGNSLSGMVVGRNEALMQRIWTTRKLHGSIIAPFDAWLLNNGLKTFHLRMPRHCANAMQVAQWLQKHTSVAVVHYPGLPSHPHHGLAKKQMHDFGGVLSFELKDGIRAGKKLMNRVKWCQLTASLGTADTLIQHPASMSHSFVPRAQRLKYGIADGLVRLAVGIEDAQLIIDDLREALK
ncbi:MAG: aminotransferase class I/II-fold pyridoxal phosphate-dependent enzyme [Chitinophagales bacterium]